MHWNFSYSHLPKSWVATHPTLWRLLPRCSRKRTWLESHLSKRTKANEHLEPGMYRSCLADALEKVAHENLAGVFSASWYYDPAVLEFSPRLSFLRNVSRQFGARFVDVSRRCDSQLFDAIRYSPTRYRAFNAKLYRPKVFAMIIPNPNLRPNTH